MDAALNHPLTFPIMLFIMLLVCFTRVAKATQIPAARLKSFFNLWMAAYLVVQGALMMLTTATALYLLFDAQGKPKLADLPIPPSFLPLAAALLGVFGFDILVSRFIVGFGETKLDFAAILQDILDRAVAATLKNEAG